MYWSVLSRVRWQYLYTQETIIPTHSSDGEDVGYLILDFWYWHRHSECRRLNGIIPVSSANVITILGRGNPPFSLSFLPDDQQQNKQLISPATKAFSYCRATSRVYFPKCAISQAATSHVCPTHSAQPRSQF